MSKHYTLRKKLFFTLIITSFIYVLPSQAQCNFGNAVGGFDPENNFDWAQTFTAECDGLLNYVEFITGSGGTQEARTLEIFEGATVSGAPFYTQDFPEMDFGTAGESLRIVLEEDFPIENGDIFTFQIPGVTVNLLVSINNPYPGGFAWENGSSFNEIVDFVFNVDIGEILSAQDNNLSNQIVYFPNPADTKLNISLEESYQTIEVSITNVNGKIVYQNTYDSQNNIAVNTSELSSGFYFVMVSANAETATFKLLKN